MTFLGLMALVLAPPTRHAATPQAAWRLCICREKVLQVHRMVVRGGDGVVLTNFSPGHVDPLVLLEKGTVVGATYGPEQVLNPLPQQEGRVFRAEVEATEELVQLCLMVGSRPAQLTLTNRHTSLFQAEGSLNGATIRLFQPDGTEIWQSYVDWDLGARDYFFNTTGLAPPSPGDPAGTANLTLHLSSQRGTNLYQPQIPIDPRSPQTGALSITATSGAPVTVVGTLSLAPNIETKLLSVTLMLQQAKARLSLTLDGVTFASTINITVALGEGQSAVPTEAYEIQLALDLPHTLSAAAAANLSASKGHLIFSMVQNQGSGRRVWSTDSVSGSWCAQHTQLNVVRHLSGHLLKYRMGEDLGRGGFCAAGFIDLAPHHNVTGWRVGYELYPSLGHIPAWRPPDWTPATGASSKRKRNTGLSGPTTSDVMAITALRLSAVLEPRTAGPQLELLRQHSQTWSSLQGEQRNSEEARHG